MDLMKDRLILMSFLDGEPELLPPYTEGTYSYSYDSEIYMCIKGIYTSNGYFVHVLRKMDAPKPWVGVEDLAHCKHNTDHRHQYYGEHHLMAQIEHNS